MADWKSKVLLVDLHRQHEEGDITLQQLAASVVTRLEASSYSDELGGIIGDFENVSEDPEADVEDYDHALSSLYDFGDEGHRIWVEAI